MSFILDALRKSETDRQRQSAPGLVDAGFRPPARRRGFWVPVLVVVLVANMVLMSAFWLRRNAGPAPEAQAAAAAARAATTGPVAGTPAPAPAPAPIGGNLAAAAGVSTPAETEYEATANMPAVESEPPYTGTLRPPAPPAPAAGEPEGSGRSGPMAKFVTDGLPTAEQLMASGVLPMEALHLDIHVYSPKQAERFVFINMRKYAEGAQLPEGPRVEEITRDGVVLSQAGQRFTLSRE